MFTETSNLPFKLKVSAENCGFFLFLIKVEWDYIEEDILQR